MIKISKNIYINKSDIKENFIKSSGPGGQHVNKVSTAEQLRINVFKSLTLSNKMISRLKSLAGSKLKEKVIPELSKL